MIDDHELARILTMSDGHVFEDALGRVVPPETGSVIVKISKQGQSRPWYPRQPLI